MTPGFLLRKIARLACSAVSCDRVLEAAIADLQHDHARAVTRGQRLRALAGGYAAFWRSLGSCVVEDAGTHASREFSARALLAFVVALGVSAAVEALVTHASVARREYLLMLVPYVGFSARTATATLRFGVPLAMFPALFYAARQAAQGTRAPALRTLACGILLTACASGWLAPSIEHRLAVRQRNAYMQATGFYIPPYPPAETWPQLIRGARAADYHRYPGYPTYVAPEDRDARRYHRLMIYDHLLLIALALAAGLLGWTGGVLATPER